MSRFRGLPFAEYAQIRRRISTGRRENCGKAVVMEGDFVGLPDDSVEGLRALRDLRNLRDDEGRLTGTEVPGILIDFLLVIRDDLRESKCCQDSRKSSMSQQMKNGVEEWLI